MNSPTILLTGASGYLGSLIAAGFLEHSAARLVLPVRSHHTADSIHDRLSAAMTKSGKASPHLDVDRIRIIPFPKADHWEALAPELRKQGIAEIVHCAGCLDYFDAEALQAVNVDWTKGLLKLGKKLKLERFTYISTAFSSGYVAGPIPETLHPEPEEDPTEYTRSKRAAEWLVVKSGLPYLIVRPSIVIGDSRDGRYGGKSYGIYQIMGGWERLMSDHYSPVLHLVAPRSELNVLHQDAFQAGFSQAYRSLSGDAIVNLVSDQKKLPTVRDLWESWIELCARPQEVYFYEKFADLPLDGLEHRQRLLMEFAEVNLQIASRPWRFERGRLDEWQRAGWNLPVVDADSLAICLRRFVQDSPRLNKYLANFGKRGPKEPRIIDTKRVGPIGKKTTPARLGEWT